jgi:hypothetical protein
MDRAKKVTAVPADIEQKPWNIAPGLLSLEEKVCLRYVVPGLVRRPTSVALRCNEKQFLPGPWQLKNLDWAPRGPRAAARVESVFRTQLTRGRPTWIPRRRR